MVGRLSDAQIDHYRGQGWLAPLDVLSPVEAGRLLRRFEVAEAEHPDQLHAECRNNAHIAFPFLAEVANHPAIVDAVRSLVGEDLVLWSTVLFIKEPDSDAFVSWHQDGTYMALDGDNFVTAWLALSSSTVESGCVSVLPGSHRRGPLPHVDRFGESNILTRGQEVDGVELSQAVHLELRPGQMSLHDPWLIHGSQPNRSGRRRVGLAMQSYIGDGVQPRRGNHHVMGIAGSPVPAPFVEVASPAVECGPVELRARAAADVALADVLYDGAEVRRAL